MIVNPIVRLLEGNLKFAIRNFAVNLPTSCAEMLVVPPVTVAHRVGSLALLAVPMDRAVHVLLTETPAGGDR